MRCQEGEEGEDDPPLVPRLGTRTGSTLLFSTTTRFSDIKQKRNYSFLTSRSIAKTSYTIRSSGVLLQTGRVFLMTFIVGVKSYMEVSNETSDNYFITNRHIYNCYHKTTAVADPGNMEREGGGGGGGGFTNGGKYIRQLGVWGSAVGSRSFASYHYCFSESYGISILFINNKNCTWDLGTRWGGGEGVHGHTGEPW